MCVLPMRDYVSSGNSLTALSLEHHYANKQQLSSSVLCALAPSLDALKFLCVFALAMMIFVPFQHLNAHKFAEAPCLRFPFSLN